MNPSGPSLVGDQHPGDIGETEADEEYPAVLNAFGTKLYSLGDRGGEASDPRVRLFQILDRGAGRYKKLFFRDDRLVGVILIGDISESQGLAGAIKKGSSYSELVKE